MDLNVTIYNFDINSHKKIKRVQYWVLSKNIYFYLGFNIFYLSYESYDIKKTFKN